MQAAEVLAVVGIATFLRLLYIVSNHIVRTTAKQWGDEKRRVFVVRIVSITHASVSGIFTLIGCYLYPELWSDPYSFTCQYGRLVSVFSMGYFTHDLIDMIIYGEALRSKEYIFHHAFSLIGLASILATGRLLGLALICLLAEVQTIFLHGRTILLLLGYNPKNSNLYTTVMRCNLGGLVLFRHIPSIYLLLYMAFWEDRAPILLRVFLICGLSFLVYHNFHLQYQFLKTDGYLGDEVGDLDEYHVDPLDSAPKRKRESPSTRKRRVG